LATLWLVNNTPCHIDKYYSEVTPMMPLHIPRGRASSAKKRVSQLALARRALKASRAQIQDGLISKHFNNRSRWHVLADNKNEIAINDLNLTHNEKEAFRKYLKYRGFYLRSRGVYSKSETEI